MKKSSTGNNCLKPGTSRDCRSALLFICWCDFYTLLCEFRSKCGDSLCYCNIFDLPLPSKVLEYCSMTLGCQCKLLFDQLCFSRFYRIMYLAASVFCHIIFKHGWPGITGISAPCVFYMMVFDSNQELLPVVSVPSPHPSGFISTDCCSRTYSWQQFPQDRTEYTI